MSVLCLYNMPKANGCAAWGFSIPLIHICTALVLPNLFLDLGSPFYFHVMQVRYSQTPTAYSMMIHIQKVFCIQNPTEVSHSQYSSLGRLRLIGNTGEEEATQHLLKVRSSVKSDCSGLQQIKMKVNWVNIRQHSHGVFLMAFKVYTYCFFLFPGINYFFIFCVLY